MMYIKSGVTNIYVRLSCELRSRLTSHVNVSRLCVLNTYFRVCLYPLII